jgi:hypothetical protein
VTYHTRQPDADRTVAEHSDTAENDIHQTLQMCKKMNANFCGAPLHMERAARHTSCFPNNESSTSPKIIYLTSYAQLMVINHESNDVYEVICMGLAYGERSLIQNCMVISNAHHGQILGT